MTHSAFEKKNFLKKFFFFKMKRVINYDAFSKRVITYDANKGTFWAKPFGVHGFDVKIGSEMRFWPPK